MTRTNIIEAEPRTPEEIPFLPAKPLVVAAAEARGITEVLHFSTMNNLVGVLATSLQSWTRVNGNPAVEKVYRQNCPDRSRDAEWCGYVSMSISRINHWIFKSSRSRWHPDAVWAILAFDVEILGHPGVVFTTTNNVYPSCLRAEGLPGFERMFADPVLGYRPTPQTRVGLPDNYTTDHCAEVLYPDALSIEYLNTIYVREDDDADHISGILAGLDLEIEVVVNPRMFRA